MRMDKLTEIKQYRADVIYIEQDDIDWLIEKVEQYEKMFTEYTGTLNETRRKRDEVKSKLAVALKEIKEQKQEIERLHTVEQAYNALRSAL